jgi:hypothetical protein
MITLEELVIARQTGEMLREQGVDPLAAITSTSNPKQEPGMIKAQDGLEVKEEVEVKEQGEQLPQLNVAGIPIPKKIFGLNVGTQAAESFGGSSMDETIYDPNKHKMKPTEMRDLIKQITVKGMMLKKDDKEIVDMINATIAKAGYSPNELAADKIKSKSIKGYELYNTDQPNPFPAYKLISSIIGGTAGNIVGGKTGARIGASIGRVGGPWGMLAGGMIGGTLGYVGSLLGYELTLNDLNRKGMLYTPTYNELGEFIGNRKGINRPTQEKLIDYLKHEAKVDAMFQGGFFAARPIFKALGGGVRNIVTGVGKNEVATARAIKEATGITPSISDISRYEIIRAMPQVIGRLPFFRRPFVKYTSEKQQQLFNTAKDKIFLNGPTFTLADLGHDMSAVRERITKEIAQSVDSKYAAWYEALGDNPAIAWNAARAKTIEGAKWMESLGLPPEDLYKNSLYRKLSNYGGLADNSPWKAGAPMTAEQWKQMRLGLTQDVLYNKDLSVEMKGVARNVLRGMEEDMANLVKANPNLYKNADKLLQDADQSFKNMMILFGDPTVKALGKNSKFAYVNQIKQPGSKYANELLDSALKDFRSPEAMERLHQILGDQMFGRVMKAKLIDSFQNAFTKSTTKPGITNIGDDFFESFDDLAFDSVSFKRSLGLDEAGKPLKRRLDALTKGLDLGADSGAKLPTAQELLNFADAAGTFFNGKNMNISTFLTRRAALGGTDSLVRVLIPAASLAGSGTAAMASPMATLLGVTAFYKASQILARPMVTDSYAEAFKKWTVANAVAGGTKKDKAVQAAVLASQRAIRELFRTDADIPNELDNRFDMLQFRTKGLNVGKEQLDEMKKLTTGEMNEAINSILGQNAEEKLEGTGMIIPGARVGDRTVPVDQPANITPINTPDIAPVATPTSTTNNLSATNKTNMFNPTRINQNSRLALAGNDPLLQGIAMNNRKI